MDWESARHLFEWDGSLLDLYVFDTDVEVWQQLLSALRASGYALRYSINGTSARSPQRAAQAFAQRERANALLQVRAGGLHINCHFFVPEQIEFDVDPREVGDAAAFASLLGFMRFVGQALRRRVVLTPEGAEGVSLLTYEPSEDGWQCAEPA